MLDLHEGVVSLHVRQYSESMVTVDETVDRCIV